MEVITGVGENERRKAKMNIGKARALFEQIASREYHGSTVGEYLEAVKIILDMETHNSISKKMIISVCKWLVEIAEKAVSPCEDCEGDVKGGEI